ncbi:MAG: RNA pseudouridine synthase [Planctomycetota bacterium]|nr:MAG: RNA pseudouridine synthase [Planctomycetota bacterium]
MARPAPLVLHDDDCLLALAKPGGMPSVPDDSGDRSLLDWGRRHAAVELHVVHRIDRPVSGVVVFAKHADAAAALSLALRRHKLGKTYWAVAEGIPAKPQGLLVQHLRKDERRNLVRSVSEGDAGAKRAVTRWRVLHTLGERALLELCPETGRSHQLRVACARLGCPLVGDVKYGASRLIADRTIGLHARGLSLTHPDTRAALRLEGPLPEAKLWNLARRWLASSEGVQP